MQPGLFEYEIFIFLGNEQKNLVHYDMLKSSTWKLIKGENSLSTHKNKISNFRRGVLNLTPPQGFKG